MKNSSGGASPHSSERSNSNSNHSNSNHSGSRSSVSGAAVASAAAAAAAAPGIRPGSRRRSSTNRRNLSNLRSNLVDPFTRRSLLRHPAGVSYHPAVHTLVEQPNFGPELVWDDIEANDGTWWPAYAPRVVRPSNYDTNRNQEQCRVIDSYSPSKVVLKDTRLSYEEYTPLNQMADDDTLTVMFSQLYGKSKSAVRSFVHRYFDTDNETTPKGTDELIQVKRMFQQQKVQMNPAAALSPIPAAGVFLAEMRDAHRAAIKLLVDQIQSVVSESENTDDTVAKGRELMLSISGEGVCNILDITDNIVRRVFSILYRHKDDDEFVRSFIHGYFDLHPEYEEYLQDDDGEILSIDRNVTRDKLMSALFTQIKKNLRISESEEHASILGTGLLRLIRTIQTRELNVDCPAELIELVFKDGLFLKDNDPLELSVKLKDVYFNGAKFHEDNMTGVKYNRRRKIDLSSDPKPWERGHPGQHPDVRRYVPGVGVVGPDISEDEQLIRMRSWWQANKPPARVINQPKQKKTETKRQSKRRRQTAKRQNYDGGGFVWSNRNGTGKGARRKPRANITHKHKPK